MRKQKYRVEGDAATLWCVLNAEGVEYDLIESRELAQRICEALNAGYGPEWEQLECRLQYHQE